MLFDTDVLIWYMRGNEKAYNLLENLPSFFISVITYMELVQGIRNKLELNKLRKALRIWNAKILYVTEDISAKAMFYVERHYLSNSLEIADSLFVDNDADNHGGDYQSHNRSHRSTSTYQQQQHHNSHNTYNTYQHFDDRDVVDVDGSASLDDNEIERMRQRRAREEAY